MNFIVIEHIPVAELPEEWRARLSHANRAGATVTVRIEEDSPSDDALAADPAFGIWRDRDDMSDVAAHVRALLRQPRYQPDGARSVTP